MSGATPAAPSARAAAIDVGGTNVRVAVDRADPSAPPSPHLLVEGPAPHTLGQWEQSVRAVPDGVHAVGIAVPGLAEGTSAVWLPNVGVLDGLDLAASVSTTLGREVAVAVGNDAQLAMLAEATHGAAAGRRDALMVAVGTGVGSAVLADGRIVRGWRGAACSLGWMCADLDDHGDPAHGWLERTASGTALDVASGRVLGADHDGVALVDAARRGDRAAMAAVEHAGRALGIAIAAAVAVLAPEVVVVSGGVVDALDQLAPSITAAMRQHLPRHLHGVRVQPSHFGERAPLVGALLAARRPSTWWEVTR